MIEYNPKEWFGFIFRFHKADTVRMLFPILLCISIYAFLVVFIFHNLLHVDNEKQWDNLSMVYSTLGFVISLLFVFRTNTAYDRWWEGRRLWGSLLNISRSLAQKMVSANVSEHDRKEFAILLGNFSFSLKNHLRNVYLPDEMEQSDMLPVNEINVAAHVPNQIAGAMHRRISELHAQGIIPDMHFLSMQTELNALYDILGGCERIRKTPIPFSYSSFLKKFIFFYIMPFPFVFLKPMGFFLIPALIFIFYVLASLELIAEEIEDPFGTDANDLPTDIISANVRRSVKEIVSNFR